MDRRKLLRWLEPLFPVVLVAAGLALAPALFLGSRGGEAPETTAPKAERFLGSPVLVGDRYVGCEVAGTLYPDTVAPAWRCGAEPFALRFGTDLAAASLGGAVPQDRAPASTVR